MKKKINECILLSLIFKPISYLCLEMFWWYTHRYKTVFADRISVFRRACCELFGYKVTLLHYMRKFIFSHLFSSIYWYFGKLLLFFLISTDCDGWSPAIGWDPCYKIYPSLNICSKWRWKTSIRIRIWEHKNSCKMIHIYLLLMVVLIKEYK